MADASDYRRIVLDARKRQLRLTADYVNRLEATYDAAINYIIRKIVALPERAVGLDWHRAQLQLIRDIDAEMVRLRRDYTEQLGGGMHEIAQATADREARIAELVEAAKDRNLAATEGTTLRLASGAEIGVQYGRLAATAVQRVSERYYRDGLNLSTRLYNLEQNTRKLVEDTIVQGITEQVSARDLAKRMEGALAKMGAANPRYNAMRIARTEINNAHREASVIAAQIDPESGTLKEYVRGIRWHLSASHPKPDICDWFASADPDGLGPGVYLPGSVPVDHPHGLCFTTTELKAFPGTVGGIGSKRPDVAAVPTSQIAYYQGLGDRAALAFGPVATQTQQ